MADIPGKRRIMLLKDASEETGLSSWELSTGAKSGKYPAFRIGGERGRWAFDIDLLNARIQELMENNIRTQDNQEIIQYGVLRKIKA